MQRGPGCGAAEQELLAKVGELLQSAPLVGLAEARSKDTTIAGKLRKLDTVTKNDKEMKAYIESQFVDESAKHAHNRELARSRWAKAQRMIVIANRIRRGSMDRGADAAAPGAAPAAAPGVLKRKPSMVGIPQKHLRVEMSEEEMQLALSVKEEIDGASWDADILAMASVLRLPMTYIVHRVLRKVGAASVLGVSDDTINLFLEELEMGYRKENPYHNGTHAADVAYTTYLMLEHGVRKAANLSSLQAVACILAAVGHDFRHPGINNNFLVHQRDDLAIVYNDKSVLEQMHLTEFFKLLKRPECNVFAKLTRAQYTEARKAIIQMVLATDMSVHFKYLAKLKGSSCRPPPTSASSLRATSTRSSCARWCSMPPTSQPGQAAPPAFKWTDRVLAEFYAQGDKERDLEKRAPASRPSSIARSKCHQMPERIYWVHRAAPLEFWSEYVPSLKPHACRTSRRTRRSGGRCRADRVVLRR